jgi:hypothetical protein
MIRLRSAAAVLLNNYPTLGQPLRDTTPKPLPGTGQLELDLQTRAAGWRYEAFATNAAPTQPDENPNEVTAWQDACHRVHARVEDHFRVGNDTGADRLPSQRFAVNAAWQRTQAIACDLIAWLRLLGCDDALARSEPATLQYRTLQYRPGRAAALLRRPPSGPYVHVTAHTAQADRQSSSPGQLSAHPWVCVPRSVHHTSRRASNLSSGTSVPATCRADPPGHVSPLSW